jgi:hypothetical protein
MTTPSARAVPVQVLSARDELLTLLRVAMAITVAVWMYVASAASFGGAGTGRKNLLPFQRVIAERPPIEQRMFRELQEGLIEAERARADTGAWPAPEALAADAIPPFAEDPTQRVRHEWTLTRSGAFVNYLGIPREDDSQGWLLLVQEPEPGIPPDQTFEDEEHHRLATGEMLHVSTWVHANGRALPRHLVRMPQAEGWTQLYAVGPSAASVPPRPAASN